MWINPTIFETKFVVPYSNSLLVVFIQRIVYCVVSRRS